MIVLNNHGNELQPENSFNIVDFKSGKAIGCSTKSDICNDMTQQEEKPPTIFCLQNIGSLKNFAKKVHVNRTYLKEA